jgi:hypothetical protein
MDGKLVQGTLFDVGAMEKTDAVFRTMKEKYGVWPVTVWELDHQDKLVHEAELAIGDIGLVRADAGKANLSYKTMGGSTRVGSFTKPAADDSVYRGKVTVSIFSPALCQWILNTFGHSPAAGKVCYDPFAGGGTRAIMAAKHGYQYRGVEIREEEVKAVLTRCEKNGVADKVEINHGDARTPPIEDGVADFILTCPPYYNLETYNGGPGDLSMLPTYDRFIDEMRLVVQEATRIAKRRCTAVWVVGLHRREADGWLLPLHHDITRLHKEAGWRLDEEIIVYHKNNGAIQRVGMFEKGNGHMVRLHEYVMVYQLGG